MVTTKIAKKERRAFTGDMLASAHKYQNLQNLPHWHDETEIVFVVSGNAQLLCDNENYELKSGEVALISSGEVHFIKGDASSIISVIKIDEELVKRSVGNLRLNCPILTEKFDIEQVYEKIIFEHNSYDELSQAVINASVTLLLAQIYRTHECVEKLSETESENAQNKRIFAYISANFGTVTFKEVATLSGFSEPYFSQYFKRISGMTFTKYLNSLRVIEAIKRLSEKKKSVTEISIECGFGTIRNFNRVFKEITGYSPKSLPSKFSISVAIKDSANMDFDPTLSTTIILQ